MWPLLKHVLVFVVSTILPGYCLTRRLMRSTGLLETVVMSLSLGLIIPSTLVFVVAWILTTTINGPLVIAVSVITILATVPWRLPSGPKVTRVEIAIVLSLAAVALGMLQVTEMHSVGPLHLFDSCMHSIVLYLQQADGSGWSLYEPATDAYTTYVVRHAMTPGLGLSSVIEDVRAANGAMIANAMVLMGRAGVDVLALIFLFLIAGSATLVASAYLDAWWARASVGIATLLGTHGVVAYLLNENAFGLAFGCVLLFLLLKRPVRALEMAVAGAVFGFVVGCRIPALMWVFPLAILLRGIGSYWPFLAGFVLSYLPWGAIFTVLKGHPFYFPFWPDVTVDHEIFGFRFNFRPLNWPFYDHLVRIPENVLPPLLYVPVKLIKSTGGPLLAAALVGFVALRPIQVIPYRRWVCATWALPVALSLAVQAYLDYEKTSYLALGMPVFPLMLAGFLECVLTTGKRGWAIGTFSILAVFLSVAPKWLANVDVPVDPRAHTEYRVVIPDNNNYDRLNYRPLERKREELAAIAVFPGFQDIVLHHSLWKVLTHPAEGPKFESGQVVVRFDTEGPKDIELPIRAATSQPRIPPPDPVLPADIREFEIMYFLVNLKVPTGPEPRVRLVSRPDRFIISIDPGPPPHTPRYITFYVDEETSEYWWERFQLVDVLLAGKPLTTRNLGFIVKQGEKQAAHVSIVTNIALYPQPDVKREISCKGYICEWQWTVLKPNGEPDQAPLPQPGEEVLDIRGPILF